MIAEDDVLHQLMAVIHRRKEARPDESYTARLFAGGLDSIGAKVAEEAAEVIEAAAESGAEGRMHTIHEAADVLYHLWVLLAYREIELEEIEAELERRFGISGLEEKASRRGKGNSA